MTVAKVWDGTQWVRIEGVPGPQGPPGPLSPPFLSVLKKVGQNEGYSGNFTTDAVPLSDGASGAMSISYTPSVDCWWEVYGQIGVLEKMDSAYHTVYATLSLSPTDEDGFPRSLVRSTQHLTANSNAFRAITSLFKLKANQAYTVSLGVLVNAQGSWRVYYGPQQLNMHAKAWAR